MTGQHGQSATAGGQQHQELPAPAGPARKCRVVKHGRVDLLCILPEGHTAAYQPGSGTEDGWHMSVLTEHQETSYDGAHHVVDFTETVRWEPVDHIAEATRHLLAGRRRDRP